MTIQNRLLSIATNLLSAETISQVRKEPFSVQGWKILDRWALNSPSKLKALENRSQVLLLNRLLEQQRMEQTALNEALGVSEGLSDMDILQQAKIPTEL
jgi:predicted XRE-type DNA-binding protein